jgi:hypothetical protein
MKYRRKLAAAGLMAATALVSLAAPAHADVFTICPDGREGVVGGHTSCVFAANVRNIYYNTGRHWFIAYSPVTGQAYEMTCVEGYTASFIDGSSRIATQCYTDDSNAEVVIW